MSLVCVCVCGSGWGCWIRTSGKRNQNPLPYQLGEPPKSGGTSGTRTRTLSRAKDFKSPSSTVPTWSHLSFFVLDPYGLIIPRAARPRTGKVLSGCAKRDLNPHTLRHRRLKPACIPISPFARCGRGCRIRTDDLVRPRHAFYQAELIPEYFKLSTST